MLNSPVGEDGKFLSGGQKQRLVIARAIYSSCKVLILDEATSSLDATSQKEVLSTIKSLKTHLTVIIIAHRQEAIDICDNIYSL
jgi:ATP-binding cassette, subfamily B, bacterial PglK